MGRVVSCSCIPTTDYRRKLEGQFLSNDTRSVWQGLQCITGYKLKHSIPGFESATPDNFNHFYARFDRQNLTPTSVSLPYPAVPLPPPFTVQEHEVRKLLKQQSSRKAAGPDNVSTATLKYCANELATVFTDLFNASLNLHIVPVCFKAASIIPVPKKPKNECESSPCRNEGRCTDRPNGYKCNCTTGYRGVTCEIGLSIALFRYEYGTIYVAVFYGILSFSYILNSGYLSIYTYFKEIVRPVRMLLISRGYVNQNIYI